MRSPFLKILFLPAFLSFALCSCDKINDKMAKTADQAASSNVMEQELLAMNVYAETFIAFLPFNNNYENILSTYKQQQISDKTEIQEYRIGFRAYNLRTGLASLERSRKTTLGGQYERLETSADALIRDTKPLLANVELLEKYQESKGYLEDKGKLARDKDAEFIAQTEAFLVAYNGFLRDYNEATIVSNQHYTEALKANGLMSKAYVYEAYFYLKQIAMLFQSIEDLKDEQRQEKALLLANDAQKSLEQLKMEAKKLSDTDGRKFKEVIDGLDALYARYNELKAGHYKSTDFERFTAEHNDFIKLKLNPL